MCISIQEIGYYWVKQIRKLTFFVTSYHSVAFETAEISVSAQSEIVFRPLEYPGFIDDPAGQSDPRADDCGLVLGFHGKLLLVEASGQQEEAVYPQEQQKELVRCWSHIDCLSATRIKYT